MDGGGPALKCPSLENGHGKKWLWLLSKRDGGREREEERKKIK